MGLTGEGGRLIQTRADSVEGSGVNDWAGDGEEIYWTVITVHTLKMSREFYKV